jgi:hypothetical protein
MTTTAGHIATSLIPSDTFTRDFIAEHISVPAGCCGFCPSYLEGKAFKNLPIIIKGVTNGIQKRSGIFNML